MIIRIEEKKPISIRSHWNRDNPPEVLSTNFCELKLTGSETM